MTTTASTGRAAAPMGRPDPAPQLRLTWRQVSAAAAVLGAIALSTRAWVAFQGWFAIDDYAFLVQASIHPLTSSDYLLRPHFGHLMPGGNALTWLVNRAAPLSFPAFVAASLVMQALAAWLAWRLLVQVFGRSPWVLVPFAVYVLSPLTMPSYVWWAAAVNALPLQIAMLLATSAHVRWLRERRTADAAWMVVWTVVGLAFFEKALLIPLVLLAVSIVLSPERRIVPAAWRAVRESWPVWLALAVLCTGYVVAYRAQVDRFGARPDIDYVRAVVSQGLSEAVIPAVVGGPWEWIPDFLTPAAAPPALLRSTALAVVAALVLLSARRRPARRAWTMLTVYLIVQIGLLVAGRSAFPSVISQQYRYYADAALLVALAVGMSTVPRERAPDAPAPARRSPPWAAAVAVLAVNLLVVGSLWSAASFARIWQENPTRTYLQTATASLHAHPELTVLDQPLPGEVVSALLSLERDQSMLFRRLPDRARFSRSPEALVVLDDTGHLRRGLVAGVTTEPGPTVGCGWRVPAGSARTIPLEIPVYRWYFTAALRYQVPSATRVEISLDGPSRTWKLDPRASSIHVPVRGGGEGLRLTNHGVAPLCVRSAVVGVAVPTGGEL